MKRKIILPPRYVCALLALVLLFGGLSGRRLRQLSVPASAAGGQGDYIFILDAGHGGEDGGASTASGVAESGLNLAITLRLDDMMHLLGMQTILVREKDTAIYDAGCETYSQKKLSDLRNRAKLVNETPGAFFVSIHQNQFSDSRYSGAQVFYNRHDPSQTIAQQLQSVITATIDPSNTRKSKNGSDSVFLLREINAPGILIECGFLSNPQEAENLQTSAYQTKLALVIAHTLTGVQPKEIPQNEV